MKAMRTPIISWFAKQMKCIAVERPQDLTRKGTGLIIVHSEITLKGKGTKFTKEIMVGDMIKITGTKVSQDTLFQLLIVLDT